MRLSPLHSLQDELDRLYEQWPANERPPFAPSASSSLPSRHGESSLATAAGKTPGRAVASTPPGAAGRAYPFGDWE